MIDAHCHILPAVDDGSQNIQESEDIISHLNSFGIDRVVCTSHIKGHMGSLEENTAAFERVLPIAQHYDVEIALGHEVNWRNLIEIGFEHAREYSLGSSDYFLLELSTAQLPHNWQTIIFNLQGEGLDVIIAHPERYAAVQKDISIVEEMRNMGCYTMLSSNYILRSWMGGNPRKCAKKLLKADLVDLICTDAHCLNDYKIFEKSLAYAEKHGWDRSTNDDLLSEIFV